MKKLKSHLGLAAAAATVVVSIGLATALSAGPASANGLSLNPGNANDDLITWAVVDANDQLHIGTRSGNFGTGLPLPAGSTSSASIAGLRDNTFEAVAPNPNFGNNLFEAFGRTGTGNLNLGPIDPNTTPAFASNQDGQTSLAYASGGQVFEDTNCEVVDPNTPIDLGAIMPGTSPSTSEFDTCGFITTWVDEQGHLGYNISGKGVTVSNITIPAGVSPTVTAFQSGPGLWRIDVPNTQGVLNEVGTQAGLSTLTATPTPWTIRGSANDTSVPAGGFVTTFVDRSNTLWVQGVSTGIKVAAGSSDPAVAADINGFAVIYDAAGNGDATVTTFDANSHATSTLDTGIQMDANKDPAITVMSGVTQPNPPPTKVPPAGPNNVTFTFVKQNTGPVPFVAKYPPLGSTEPGKVLSITYPSAGHANTAIELLRNGAVDCNFPANVVTLNPGQTTTAAQINTLYGSATSFATTAPFTATACFAGSPVPNTLPVSMSVQFN